MGPEYMRTFIANMPKAELHLHIEGTLSPETILRLAQRNGVDFPYRSVEEIRQALAARPAGLEGFLDHHYLRIPLLQTERDFFDMTFDLLRSCKENNIVYTELFFDPQVHTSRGISFDDVIEGIDRGRRSGAEAFGVEANLIMCINRDRSVESAFEMLDQARPHRRRIIGLGMDSYEEGHPPRKFEEVYSQAREEGYRLTAHCDVDQTDSVAHIWECLDLLNVERIDHGVNTIDDPSLVEEVKRRKIPLTTCPIWRSSDPAPQDTDRIKSLFDHGVLVTLNSDDPAEFDSGYLTNLIAGVQQASGYSKGDLVRLTRNTFEASWLPLEAKNAYIEDLHAYAEANGVETT